MFDFNPSNYRKLLELLPDMRGITVKSFKINSIAPPIFYLAVDFKVRRSWFTDKEVKFLKDNGFISAMGSAIFDDKHNYNTASAGMNDIIQNFSDYQHFIYYINSHAGSRSWFKEEKSGSQNRG